MAEEFVKTWQKLMEGSHDALEELYSQHYLGLINYGIKLTGDRQYANDCFIEMLIDLWGKRSKLPQVNNVRSYLMTCLRMLILQKQRSEKLREVKETYAHSLLDHQDLPYEEYITRIQTDSIVKTKLQQSLNKLTDRQKELLQYRFFYGMSYDEIALKCQISKKTAYNIIHDAISKLKIDLGKDKGSEGLYAMAITAVILVEFVINKGYFH